jgi:hypothetical protein
MELMSNNWIEIKSEEYLPSNPKPVICYGEKSGIFIASYVRYLEVEVDSEESDNDGYDMDHTRERVCLKPGWYELEEQGNDVYDEAWFTRIVTHWQPLPKKPFISNLI